MAGVTTPATRQNAGSCSVAEPGGVKGPAAWDSASVMVVSGSVRLMRLSQVAAPAERAPSAPLASAITNNAEKKIGTRLRFMDHPLLRSYYTVNNTHRVKHTLTVGNFAVALMKSSEVRTAIKAVDAPSRLGRPRRRM